MISASSPVIAQGFLQDSSPALFTYLTLTMSTINTGSIVGNIVSDIETKRPNDALSVTQFRIAPSNANENDSPIPVVAYNGEGERISQRFNKGDLVAIQYRLRYVTWQDQEGNPRGRHEVVVTRCDMLRLGKICTAQRAEQAANGGEIVTTRAAFSQEPTAEVVPF